MKPSPCPQARTQGEDHPATLKKRLKEDPSVDPHRGPTEGVSEGPPPAAPPLRDAKKGELLIPAHHVNDSVTKAFLHVYGCAEPVEASSAPPTLIIAGKTALWPATETWQGCAEILRTTAPFGANVDPINSLQACMAGYKWRPSRRPALRRHLRTTTANGDILHQSST